MSDDQYIPALKYHWLTPLYDGLVRLTGDIKLKRRFTALAEIKAGERILDVGCGTGTLLGIVKETEPDAELFGLDCDPGILKIARSRFARENLSIRLDLGMAFDLPYADGHFDRVISSYMIHHLTTENKERAFRECLRVLRPGGAMVILDFGPPVGRLMKVISILLSRHEQISDNLEGRLPDFAASAGFHDIETLGHSNTIFGTVWIFRGRKATGSTESQKD